MRKFPRLVTGQAVPNGAERYEASGDALRAVDPAPLPCESDLSYFLPSQAHGVVARPLFFAGKRLRRTGHRPEVDPLSLARHFKRHPLAAWRAGRARGKRAS